LKDSSFLVLNADLAFDARILPPALSSEAPITMIVDPEWREETMKVVIARDRIVRMSKQITRSEFSATYIGITVIGDTVQRRLFDRIADLLDRGQQKAFFNVAVQQMADEGVHVAHSGTDGLPWAEIDDPGDLAFARRNVFPELVRIPVAA
jgi:choline kinase